MENAVRVDVVRHQVAVHGSVVDAKTRRPIPSALIGITGEKSGVKLQTRTNHEGLYYFLDVPDGRYKLDVTVPAQGARSGVETQRVRVSRDAEGNVQRVKADVAINMTAVVGKVLSGSAREGVWLAEVSVKGSGERTFTNRKGEYSLWGIEPGKRRIEAVAPGLKSETKQVSIGEPGSSETVDFHLKRQRTEE